MLTLDGIRLAPGAMPLRHEFRPGGICVVLGRNRSGKTRLCRLLAGLAPAEAGRVLLDGRDIGGLSPGKRPVALVNQAFVNYPNLTVAENIASPLRARGVSRGRRSARVRELAGQLGIGELLDRYPRALSGGQQQRVAIARALAKEARILVLDEPLVNLDFKLREAFEAELRGMLGAGDTVVVYTTSDPRDAFNLGDEVLLLHEHILVQAGAPLAVYQAPASSVAADLMSEPGINRWTAQGVLHCVRPEHLDVQRRAPSDVTFATQLLAFETNGSETYLHCRFQDQHWVAKIDGLLSGLRIGEPMALFAPGEALLRFPEERRVG